MVCDVPPPAASVHFPAMYRYFTPCSLPRPNVATIDAPGAGITVPPEIGYFAQVSGSRTTLAGWLARMGFADAARAEVLLLNDLGTPAAELRTDPVVAAIAVAADPELALTGMARLFGAT